MWQRTGPKALSVMLQEVTMRTARQSRTWWASDHQGSVGAALCWQHQKESASTADGHANRLDQTSTAQWGKQLRDLEQHGFNILGYQTKVCVYFKRTASRGD